MWGLRETDGKTGTSRFPLAGEMARTGMGVSFKMVGPGRKVTPGTGPILKTTRGYQVRLPFLPQAKRRGRGKTYLYVGLIESDVREFCPGFTGDYPGIAHRHPFPLS